MRASFRNSTLGSGLLSAFHSAISLNLWAESALKLLFVNSSALFLQELPNGVIACDMKLVPLCELEPEVRERIPLCTCGGQVDAAAIENRLQQEVLHTLLSIPSHSTSACLSLSQPSDSLSLSQSQPLSLSLSVSASQSQPLSLSLSQPLAASQLVLMAL